MDRKISDIDLTEEISLYTRISVDTEKESDENTSIENQLKIIHNYIKQHFPKCTYKEYIDRDRSGYTFEQRENYQDMRKALLGGKSKILIVKDFSRFSRRTSLGLWELEQMRDAGVRIISIMDACDYPTHDDWLNISIRFMTNELPVTDTSKKVKNSITMMQKEGEWLCAVPYGYILQEVKNRQIIFVVPDEAEIVKEIYRLYSYEGWGYKKIANYLTEKNIPTPRMKEKQRAEENGIEYRRKVSTAWSVQTIDGMLRNDFYIGVYRGHKYTRAKINGADVRLDESEHIVIEKHHESILDDKTYLYTQEIVERRTKSATHYRGVKKYETPYTGYLFCGDCKAPMFSRSRPDLEPSYICGTYHKRGLKGCTTHHTRFDFLDSILKDYVRLIKENCKDMIDELEKTIASETDSVKDSDKIIAMLENQLANAKEELKATKKQKIKELARSQGDSDLIEETYLEIEEEITNRIHGLQEQLKSSVSKRSKVVEIARVSKTVFDVFDSILEKPKLSKVDIALIVDKIFVYESGTVEIKLKADIEKLLQTGTLPNKEQTVNFNFDSIDSEFITVYSQKIPKRRERVYTVNVVSEGDPLEIYTERDGEVIFKKYSPIGELGEFAVNYAETLNKTMGIPTVITDRDSIIAVSGVSKKELLEKRVSSDIENLMTEKESFKSQGFDSGLSIAEGNDSYNAGVVVPIVSEGDTIGSVIFLITESGNTTETEMKVAETAATFLGRHMEG